MSSPRFRYQIRSSHAILIFLFFSASIYTLVHWTLHYAQPTGTQRGFVLNWAVVLCFSCALFLTFLFAAFLVSVLLNNVGQRYVELTDKALIAPQNGLRRKMITIPYATLRKIEVLKRPQSSLLLHYEGGWLVIPAFMLPDKAAFQALGAALQAKLP
jgi:hypothetical protein